MARQRTEQTGQKGRGQNKPGRSKSASSGSGGRERSTDDLKRQARNAEAEQERKQEQEQEQEKQKKQQQEQHGSHTNGATHMPDAGRQMAEDFADRSRQQIDRYERAFGEFWKVAESDGFVPLTKGVAKANMEMAGLASRRAKAYVEFPVDLTRCETPQDVVNRQMRFWTDMMRDYQTTLGRVTRNWADSANPQRLQQMMQETGDQMRESMSGISEAMGQGRGGGQRRGGGRE